MEPVAEAVFQVAIGVLAGAVTGEVASGELAQSIRNGWQILRRGAHEVEAAHENIRAEVPDDIENAAVGTAAEEDAPAVLFDEEVELVPEIIGHADSSSQSAHAGSWRYDRRDMRTAVKVRAEPR